MSVDQIRKTFEAGFRAGVEGFYPLPEDVLKQRMQHAWKKFCGVDT